MFLHTFTVYAKLMLNILKMMSDVCNKPSHMYNNMKQWRKGKGKHITTEGRIGEAEMQNAKAEQESEPKF